MDVVYEEKYAFGNFRALLAIKVPGFALIIKVIRLGAGNVLVYRYSVHDDLSLGNFSILTEYAIRSLSGVF